MHLLGSKLLILALWAASETHGWPTPIRNHGSLMGHASEVLQTPFKSHRVGRDDELRIAERKASGSMGFVHQTGRIRPRSVGSPFDEFGADEPSPQDSAPKKKLTAQERKVQQIQKMITEANNRAAALKAKLDQIQQKQVAGELPDENTKQEVARGHRSLNEIVAKLRAEATRERLSQRLQGAIEALGKKITALGQQAERLAIKVKGLGEKVTAQGPKVAEKVREGGKKSQVEQQTKKPSGLRGQAAELRGKFKSALQKLGKGRGQQQGKLPADTPDTLAKTPTKLGKLPADTPDMIAKTPTKPIVGRPVQQASTLQSQPRIIFPERRRRIVRPPPEPASPWAKATQALKGVVERIPGRRRTPTTSTTTTTKTNIPPSSGQEVPSSSQEIASNSRFTSTEKVREEEARDRTNDDNDNDNDNSTPPPSGGIKAEAVSPFTRLQKAVEASLGSSGRTPSLGMPSISRPPPISPGVLAGL